MRQLHLLLIICLILSISAKKEPKWKCKEWQGDYNKRIGGHCAVTIGDSIYTFGGFEESISPIQNNIYYNSIYRYDTSNKKVYNISASLPVNVIQPEGRTFPTCTYYNNAIYIFGGVTYISTANPYLLHNFNDLWKFDLSSNTWTQINASGPVPAGRNSVSAWLDGSQWWMYAGIGGGVAYNYRDYADMYYYDFITNTWVNVTYLVPANATRRYAAATTRIGSTIYIVGGERLVAGAFGFLLDILTYDTITKTFAQITSNNLPRKGGPYDTRRFRGISAYHDQQLGLQLIIHGNYLPDGQLTSFWLVDWTDRYDVSENKWYPISTKGSAPFVNRNSQSIVGDKIYIIGGFNSASNGTIHWNPDICTLNLKHLS